MNRGVRAWIGTLLRPAVVFALVLSWVPLADAQGDARLLSMLRNLPERIPFPVDAAQAKSAVVTRSEKIHPLLLALSDDVAAKGPSSLSASAEALQVGVSDDMVAVELFAEDLGGREEIEWRVEDEGGVVTATLDNVVLANLPVDRIEAFEDEPSLHYMTAQAQFSFRPPDGGVVFRPRGEAGLQAVGVERLHAAAVTGRGVKVGILDFGFEGYQSLVQRGAVPQAAAQRAFNKSGRLENGNPHGTACAEIVHAVAPDAELYLAAVDGLPGQIVAAAEWLVAQRVDIISFSGGGHFGPHNGAAPLDRLVDRTTQAGVLWVNAAGNEGSSHWGGSATDRDGDQIVELDGRWQGVLFQPSNGLVNLLVNWDDWGPDPMLPAATQDIDAYLFEVTGDQQYRFVARSINPQNGRGPPIEHLSLRGLPPGGVYLLALRANRLTRPVRLHVYQQRAMGGPMAPKSGAGSIGIPATSPSALAVGAVHVSSGLLEPFSSQGPTDDRRTKPDVSAPDNTPSLAYDGAFPGTSAACPHVSGFAALLKQITPAADPEALSAMVIRHVRAMGGATPNNQYGHGHIDATGVDVNRPITTDRRSPVVLPDYLGGRTSGRTLDALWERGEDRTSRLGLRVRVNLRPGRNGEPPRYRLGDPMKVGFATDERCRYTLILRDARGSYRVMSSAELEPGEPRLLPEEEGVSWTISEPVGDEGFLLVCARGEVDVEAWGGRGDARDVEIATTEYRVVR